MSKERGFSVPVDLIRTVAIVGVILLHAANDLTSQQMNWFEIVRWNTVTVYQSVGRLKVRLADSMQVSRGTARTLIRKKIVLRR